MERIIKFRAWKKRSNDWIYLPETGDIDLLQDGESIEFDYDKEDIIIQQFTGLKDKNGVEIYEGDIDVNFGEIYYNPKWGRYEARRGDLINTVNDLVRYSGTIEIIGNIHQNPELLNK